MAERRMDVVNRLIEESFGEGFRADLKVRQSFGPFGEHISRYEISDEPGFVFMHNHLIGPFNRYIVKGRFSDNGQKLAVPKKYLPNAEKYSSLAGFELGQIPDIVIDKKAAWSHTATDFRWGMGNRYAAAAERALKIS